MKFNLIFQPLGLRCSPIGSFKHNPLLAAAALGAGAGVISGIGNWFSQSDTNKQSERIAKENREWQSKENRLSEQWQEKMWNQQNQYNTPSAMKQRMLDAGMNPWISSGVGNPMTPAGSAGTPTVHSAPSMPNLVAPQVPDLTSSLLQAAGVKSQVANTDALTAEKAAEVYSKLLKAGVDKAKAYGIFQNIMKSAGKSDNMISSLDQSINQDFLKSKIDNDRNALEYFIRNEFGRSEAKKQLEKIDKDMSYIDQQILSLKKGRQLSDAQIRNLAQDTAKKLSETLTINGSREYIISKLQYESEILQADPMRSGLFSDMMKGSTVLGNVGKFIAILLKFLK